MEIGSHGYDHFWLNSLNLREQKADILKSLDLLKAVNNKRDKLIFCYPYGGYNKITKKILNSYNFEAAVTTKVGLVDDSVKDILDLPRLDTNDLPKKNITKISHWTKKIIN